MALATRCPSCQALFRVAPDQLKLRGGLVRCGACRHVFDAIGTLSYVDDAVLATTAPAASPAVGAVIAAIRKAESTVGGGMEAADAPAPDESPALEPPAAAAAGDPSDPVVPFEDEAVVEFEGSAEEAPLPAAEMPAPVIEASAEAPAVAAPSEPVQEPTPDPSAVAEQPGDAAPIKPLETPAAAEPSFLRQAQAPKPRRTLLHAGAVLLAVLALAQLAVLFRAEIIAAMPQARPALGQLCRLFGCTVSWPGRPELLAVVGTELQALPGTDLFELTAVVRNRSQITMALPAIELTLSDTLDRTVARKVFAPADYLAGSGDAESQIDAGLAAGADLTVRIPFEARGVNAAGFVVYPFYL